MSLKALESVDISIGTFLDTNEYFRAGSGSVKLLHANIAVAPKNPGGGDTVSYADQKDLVILLFGDNSGFLGAGLMDPLYLDSNSPKAFVGSGTGAPSVSYYMGEWDQFSGVAQKIYGFENFTADALMQLLDPVDFNFPTGGGNPAPFPNIGSEKAVGAITSTGDTGSYDQASTSCRVWEQWGQMLRIGRLRHTDTNLYNAMFLVDLTGDTPPPGEAGLIGLATMIDVTVSYQSTPTNPTGFTPEAPVFLGDAFELTRMQFVADDDDSPAQPKGRVFLWSENGIEDDVSVADTVVGKLWYRYVKVIDWNPFSKAATPGNANRVHLRETLLTRMNYTANEAPGTNPTSMGVGEASGTTLTGQQPYFHPPTRTMRTHFDWTTGGTPRDAVVVIHSLTPAIAQITAPTALADVETNKTVAFESIVQGDIGEAIAATVVDWTLERVSTDREELDTDATMSGPPATSIVDNPPIDAGSLIIEQEDPPGTFTLLTEGAGSDYTVVEATGVITWEVGITGTSPAGPAPEQFFASYEHRNTPATPPHGTLLQGSSQSDVDGRAQTRVRYADDTRLVAHLDRLEAEATDD